MWAARSGCEKTSQELLDKQAALDHVNKHGDTALHIASSYGNVKVVELLLNFGANVCIQNSLGQSCLDVAVLSGVGDVALAIAQHKRLVCNCLIVLGLKPVSTCVFRSDSRSFYSGRLALYIALVVS